MKKPLIIIAGPTAVGKTSAAIGLAKQIGGEIISADSMQIYKYMDIGTAKPDKIEMDGVKHYLIDELYPNEEFNVYIFKEMAKRYMHEIWAKGKTPIIVGGTGFYINALLYDTDFTKMDTDISYREHLVELAKEKGLEFIYDMLKKIDPEYADNIHANNSKRVIRALEYYNATGEKFSKHNEEQKKKTTPYDAHFFVLNMERQELYERINLRVDLMLRDGLLNEVKSLLAMGYQKELVSMQGLGYKEFMPYIEKKTLKEEAVENLKKGTRHFAKRQITWFKGQADGIWIDVSEKTKDEIINEMMDSIGVSK